MFCSAFWNPNPTKLEFLYLLFFALASSFYCILIDNFSKAFFPLEWAVLQTFRHWKSFMEKMYNIHISLIDRSLMVFPLSFSVLYFILTTANIITLDVPFCRQNPSHDRIFFCPVWHRLPTNWRSLLKAFIVSLRSNNTMQPGTDRKFDCLLPLLTLRVIYFLFIYCPLYCLSPCS